MHSSYTTNTRGAPLTIFTVFLGTVAIRKLFALSVPPNGNGVAMLATSRRGPNVSLPGSATRISRTNRCGVPFSSPITCTHVTYVRPSGPIVG